MTPKINAEFTHRDFSTGKRRHRLTRLVVHKVYENGAAVAHISGHEPDKDGWYAQIQCFPRGLDEGSVTWLEEEAPAFVPGMGEKSYGLRKDARA